MAHRIVTSVDTISTVFDDYSPDARERLEGTHTRIEVHVPNAWAAHIGLGTLLVLEADEVHG